MTRTGPTREVALLVMSRADGMCLRCLRRPGAQIHHRKPRGMGGTVEPAINRPPNLVWLCSNCHAWVESNRLAGYDTGWLVRRADNPAEKWLIDNFGQMLMLLPSGDVELSPPSDMVLPSGGLTPPF